MSASFLKCGHCSGPLQPNGHCQLCGALWEIDENGEIATGYVPAYLRRNMCFKEAGVEYPVENLRAVDFERVGNRLSIAIGQCGQSKSFEPSAQIEIDISNVPHLIQMLAETIVTAEKCGLLMRHQAMTTDRDRNDGDRREKCVAGKWVQKP